MADIFDKATRSRIMRAIKCRDTKPELRLAAALRAAGVAYRREPDLPGRPDFAVPCFIAVFVHGCYWHACPRHFRMPKSRVSAWRKHFDQNRRRDERVRRRLRKLGWKTMVVWEHERPERAAARVAGRIKKERRRWAA